jgi:fatty-acyl-CoA synthase
MPAAETEVVVIVAESRHAERSTELAREIRQHLRSSVGLTPSDVLVVKPGQLPKTSSGKLQRQRAKQMYAAGSFSPKLDAVASDV